MPQNLVGICRESPPLDARHRLSTRIIFLSLVALLTVLAMISGTLWLAWRLEGAGAAINDAGSLRMRANRVAIDLSLPLTPSRNEKLITQIEEMDRTLEGLRQGNSERPLFLPNEPGIRAQLGRVTEEWRQRMKPMALGLHTLPVAGSTTSAYLAALPGFVEEANKLVLMIERDNAEKTRLLWISQLALAIMACVGTLAVIHLLYRWIILPVRQLQHGLQRMAAREFELRLPVASRDEFGMLAQGFNRMASELQALYRGLEAHVEQNTAELAGRNRALEALYDMAAFLNLPGDTETLCRGFLARVMRQFDADSGSVRLLDPRNATLHLVVSEGLSDELVKIERCQNIDDCFSGDAITQAPIFIADLQEHYRLAQPTTRCYRCIREGLPGLGVIPIATQSGTLGSFSLHFRQPKQLAPQDRQLLEALGQHLGTAIENLRLFATARQLAIEKERNLVAQGLHDSIAQGLNFLNLQVQLLDAAVARQDFDEMREIVPLLRCGVEESYQDVRELLQNFRARLDHGNFHQAVEDTVARFRRQTHTELKLAFEEARQGPPLDPEQQLQVLFILQEALSNVRKHACAEHVSVTIIDHGLDFRMIVEDDGDGFDPEVLTQASETHVGLHIMRERAMRLAAQLSITSRPGAGVRVELILPRPGETARVSSPTTESL
ncbi:MAG: type IV pili methyl-accepting chemotaxis transducer N-terminal domain-containing protein [Betaproteobacteria bacterium]|nr:type IV pili methyl-accepting chemotaxis transducer N-terminal domain-containing protein [Betaproteobacteria bacterium]